MTKKVKMKPIRAFLIAEGKDVPVLIGGHIPVYTKKKPLEGVIRLARLHTARIVPVEIRELHSQKKKR